MPLRSSSLQSDGAGMTELWPICVFEADTLDRLMELVEEQVVDWHLNYQKSKIHNISNVVESGIWEGDR